MSFDYNILLDDCWDGEYAGDRFKTKIRFDPLIMRKSGEPTTIGFVDFVEQGINVYRMAGELDTVVHHLEDEPYTELKGRICW